MSKYIYIPIEVAKREALPKSFLAASLVKRGFKVIIFQDYIFDKHGYPGPGIYIGKNCFKTEVPYSMTPYKRMKKQGVKLLYLDEEGGLFAGASAKDWKKNIVKRVDPKSFSSDDYYLSWGKWQAEVYREQSNAKVVITGSSNFEICKQKYNEALSGIDCKIKKNINKYILINTRFSIANPLKGSGEVIGENSAASKLHTLNYVTSSHSLDYIYLGHFINMVRIISNKFINTKIVIRPHPGENEELYKNIFRSYENIIVTNEGNVATWLRDSIVLIHNGCTTAIQAKFSDTTVINYEPILDNDIDNREEVEIRNVSSIGNKAHSVQQIVNLINLIIKNQQKQDNSDHVYDSINNINPFKVIADLVSTITIEKSTLAKIKLNIVGLKVNFRHALNRLLMRKTVFDYNEFNRIPSYTEAASKHFCTKIKVKKLCDGIYILESL